jgi:hypothetical protein
VWGQRAEQVRSFVDRSDGGDADVAILCDQAADRAEALGLVDRSAALRPLALRRREGARSW